MASSFQLYGPGKHGYAKKEYSLEHEEAASEAPPVECCPLLLLVHASSLLFFNLGA